MVVARSISIRNECKLFLVGCELIIHHSINAIAW